MARGGAWPVVVDNPRPFKAIRDPLFAGRRRCCRDRTYRATKALVGWVPTADVRWLRIRRRSTQTGQGPETGKQATGRVPVSGPRSFRSVHDVPLKCPADLAVGHSHGLDPALHALRPYHGDSVDCGRAQPAQPYENRPVDGAAPQPFGRFLAPDQELMAEDQNFCFEPRPRSDIETRRPATTFRRSIIRFQRNAICGPHASTDRIFFGKGVRGAGLASTQRRQSAACKGGAGRASSTPLLTSCGITPKDTFSRTTLGMPATGWDWRWDRQL